MPSAALNECGSQSSSMVMAMFSSTGAGAGGAGASGRALAFTRDGLPYDVCHPYDAEEVPSNTCWTLGQRLLPEPIRRILED